MQQATPVAMLPARADSLLSRDLPDNLDRRRAIDEVVDIDISHPARRSTDAEAMAYRLAAAEVKQLGRRFTGESVTNFGALGLAAERPLVESVFEALEAMRQEP